jgi:hypothetical protein
MHVINAQCELSGGTLHDVCTVRDDPLRVVAEPAALAPPGLGLAGVGVAQRRRRGSAGSVEHSPSGKVP